MLDGRFIPDDKALGHSQRRAVGDGQGLRLILCQFKGYHAIFKSVGVVIVLTAVRYHGGKGEGGHVAGIAVDGVRHRDRMRLAGVGEDDAAVRSGNGADRGFRPVR